MIKKYVGLIRVAFALVCIGASLILAAQWFGIIPDPLAQEERARRALSETIAINATPYINSDRWIDLKQTLQRTVDHHPRLMSIGVRNDLGILKLDTGHHRELWDQLGGEPKKQNEGDETADNPQVDKAYVPITINHSAWGRLEFCFRHRADNLWQNALGHPQVKLLIFFFTVGLFAYTLFVARMLGVFSSTQVVPDRVRQALDTLAEGLLVLDENGRIVLANRAFTSIVEKEPEQLEKHLASELPWITEESDLVLPWSSALSDGELQSERMLRYQLPGGKQRIFSVNAAPLGKDKSGRGVLATFRDVTHVEEHRIELERMLDLIQRSRDEITQKNEELEVLATTDSLTSCLNRRAFFKKFGKLWEQAHLEEAHLSCIMIDVDHFKSVNDTYGHHIGDEVLKAVSAAIRGQLAEIGLVCRYGGEEFCAVLANHDIEEAVRQAEAVRAAIGKIRLEEPAELRLTASLGVSELRFNPRDEQELINQADACLYVAKREGRNQTVLYNVSMAEVIEPENEEETYQAPESNPLLDNGDIPYKAVTALMSTLSYRDTRTAQHSHRVANLCSRAADGLLNPSEKYALEVAALLHDIGKVGVPDQILFKTGTLTSSEWEVMGRYDQISVDIVEGSFDCPYVTSIISTYRAYYDGNSRKRSMPVGEDIPLGARILAIADAYDAMTNGDPYRAERTHAKAIKELRDCAGTQFDPNLVEHFIQKVDDTIPHVTFGAIRVQEFASIRIGNEIEKLSESVAAEDTQEIYGLFDEIRSISESIGMSSITEALPEASDHPTTDRSRQELLQEARNLIDTCRSAQIETLRSTFEKIEQKANSHENAASR